MNRKLKALGLAMFAAFAFSAIGASAAQATEDPEFLGAPTATATAEGKGSQVFTAFGQNVECSKATFEVERLGDASTATVEPTYTNCEAFGLPATVDMTSCDYVFSVDATGGSGYTGSADVVCAEEGDTIDITVYASQSAHESDNPICHVEVPEQENLPGLEYSNSGGHVNVDGTATGITATQNRTSIFCPAGTHDEGAEYSINETTTVEGENHAGGDEEISVG